MNFYWRGEKDQVSCACTPDLDLIPTTSFQLRVRHGSIPASVEGVVDPWTTFHITLREPGPIPAALNFTRFLASSITFMTHLSEVSVYFDNKQLVRLSKYRGVAKKVPMLRGLKGTSPKGMMNVKSIETTRKFCCGFKEGLINACSLTALHIKAEVVRWIYSVGIEKPSAISKTETVKTGSHHFLPLFDGIESSSTPQEALAVPEESINLLEAESSSIVLTIFAANVDVRVDEKMTVELLRATKKNPPSRLRYELIYVSLVVVECILKIGSYFCSDRER